MNIKEKKINTLTSDGHINEIVIRFDCVLCNEIEVNLGKERVKTFKGKDLFHCFQLINVFFYKKNIKILCNAARINVYPSGMSRSMSMGRKAYLLTFGKRVVPDDLVDILEFCESDFIATVKEQEEFHKNWLKSF